MIQASLLIISLLIIAEISAYFWHRIGSHSDLVGSEIHRTHKNHHNETLDHKAHEDFYWALLFMGGLYFVFAALYQLKVLNLSMSILYPSMFLLIFIINWYIHSAYHTENHWLNKFEWFQNNKSLHFQHHYNPSKNYDIVAPSIFDRLFGTYELPVVRDELKIFKNIPEYVTINYDNLSELMSNL